MTLPTIEVPSRLAGAFVSEALHEVDLATLGADSAGQAMVNTGAKFAQVAALRMWESLPQLVPDNAQGVLDIAWTSVDAAATFRNAELGDKLAAITEGGMAVLDTMFEAMSIVESVPLIGIIAKVGATVQRIFWNQWIAAHKTPPAQQGFAYDRDSDEFWMREVLQYIDAGDLTGIFAPYIERPQTWDVREVQDLLKHGKNRWTFCAPQGEQTGIGNVPGTTSMSQGYQSMWGWGDYRPGTQQACANAWQLVLAHSRMRYMVDVHQLVQQWDHYWLAVQLGAIFTPSKKDSGIVGVLARAQRPLVPIPAGLYGNDAAAYKVQMEAKGYRHWGSYYDAYPFELIAKRGFAPTMQGLVRHNLNRQLRGRQVDGLKTLLVAYCSESDPAFRSDAQLREILLRNRGLLLGHNARWQVDLERVPDPDYREELRKRTTGFEGPSGLKLAPPKKTFGAGQLSGGATAGNLPVPPLGFRLDPPQPMIAGGVYPSTGNKAVGAAALALLGFLVR